MPGDAEYIDLIFREIGKQDAIKAAKEIESAVAKLSDTQIASYREQSRRAKEFADIQAIEARTAAQNAAARQAAHQRAVQSTAMMITGFNQGLELVRRFTQQWVALGSAILAVIENNRTMSRELDALRAQADSLAQSFSDGVEEGGHLLDTLRGMNDSIDDFGSATRALGALFDQVFNPIVVTNFTNAVVAAAGSVSTGVLGAVARLGLAGDAAGLIMGRLQGRGQGDAGADAWAANRREEQAAERSNALDAELQEFLDMNEGRSSGRSGGGNLYNTPTGPRQRRGGGGGGGAGRRDWLSAAGYEGATAAAQASNEAILENIREQSRAWAALNEQRRTQEEELRAADEQGQRERIESLNEEMELKREIHQQAMEWAEQEKQQQISLTQFMRDQSIEAANAIGDGFSAAAGIVGQLAQREQEQIANIRAVLEASGASEAQIAEATKEHVERLDRLSKVEGSFLIAFNTVKAATAAAQAIEAAASYRYGAAAAYTVAAAEYAANAGLAAARLGDDGSSGGVTARSPATAQFAPDRREREEEAGPAYGTNLTIFTLGTRDSRLAEQLERARWELQRSGLDPAMVPSGPYE